MIYADAGIIIRLIEGAAKVRSPIEVRLQEIRSQGPLILTSRLSRLECRCKPLREKNDRLLQLYDAFFIGAEVKLAEIGPPVIEQATQLRASLGLKSPDAIHAATGMLAAVSEFWTADRAYMHCPELNVVLFEAV